jgi:hypothetical protein
MAFLAPELLWRQEQPLLSGFGPRELDIGLEFRDVLPEQAALPILEKDSA